MKPTLKFRAAAAAAGMIAGLIAYAGTALAAPPANDTQSGAWEFAVPPAGSTYGYGQYTTEATVDASEDVVRDYCLGLGAAAFEHAVWYKTVVPPGGGGPNPVVLDVTQSSYGVGMAILQDTGSGLVALDCVSGTFVLPGGAPEGTYYVVAFGDGTTTDTSGELVFNVALAPLLPVVDLTVDPVGRATKEGGAWISGAASCTGGGANAVLVAFIVRLTQTVGRLIISSDLYVEPVLPCDGVSYPWQGYVPPNNGKFAGGKAATVTYIYACGSTGDCSQSYVDAVVKLNRAR